MPLASLPNLAAAADAFGYGYLYEEARCRWRLAEAWLLEGDRDQAAVQARAAHEIAERLDAAPLLAALEALGRRARLDRKTASVHVSNILA